MHGFRYPRLWLALGWFGILILIGLSLLPVMFQPVVANGDKLGHLLAYGVLMGWFVQLFQQRRTIFLYAVGLIFLGVVLEFLQQLTGRYFDVADMLANTLGVSLGWLTAVTPFRHVLLKLEPCFIRRE